MSVEFKTGPCVPPAATSHLPVDESDVAEIYDALVLGKRGLRCGDSFRR